MVINVLTADQSNLHVVYPKALLQHMRSDRREEVKKTGLQCLIVVLPILDLFVLLHYISVWDSSSSDCFTSMFADELFNVTPTHEPLLPTEH